MIDAIRNPVMEVLQLSKHVVGIHRCAEHGTEVVTETTYLMGDGSFKSLYEGSYIMPKTGVRALHLYSRFKPTLAEER